MVLTFEKIMKKKSVFMLSYISSITFSSDFWGYSQTPSASEGGGRGFIEKITKTGKVCSFSESVRTINLWEKLYKIHEKSNTNFFKWNLCDRWYEVENIKKIGFPDFSFDMKNWRLQGDGDETR